MTAHSDLGVDQPVSSVARETLREAVEAMGPETAWNDLSADQQALVLRWLATPAGPEERGEGQRTGYVPGMAFGTGGNRLAATPIPEEHVHEWALNHDWNGGPSPYPIVQCVLCNATPAPDTGAEEPATKAARFALALRWLGLSEEQVASIANDEGDFLANVRIVRADSGAEGLRAALERHAQGTREEGT